MIKFKNIHAFVSALLLCLMSAGSIADLSSEHDIHTLQNYPGYIKYEDPTTKGIIFARVLRNGVHIVMELYSPAYNIHGVETIPEARTDKEQAQVDKATAEFKKMPEQYVSFLPKNVCSMEDFTYTSKPITDQRQSTGGASSWYINVGTAKYEFICEQPDPKAIIIDLFKPFPLINEIQVQLIENEGKLRRIKLTPNRTMIEFKSESSS